ncbi:hypothetical protein Tcan_05203 [Toxocara canis]|uniref:Uncharacterized protein n=1 Tax=Toxocara canis TaxID=6265 RepID=A0A0B2V555_TOXCA|nr:hypothetical protein Tcan_05203 [Toxocara canis]
MPSLSDNRPLRYATPYNQRPILVLPICNGTVMTLLHHNYTCQVTISLKIKLDDISSAFVFLSLDGTSSDDSSDEILVSESQNSRPIAPVQVPFNLVPSTALQHR